MAAREFGAQAELWQHKRRELLERGWLEADDLLWQPDPYAAGHAAEREKAWRAIQAEVEELQVLMQDDREVYLAELEAQADGAGEYFIAFIGASRGRHPWTLELIDCAHAIGQLTYMFYKSAFKRVRPTTLCPGLTPPFGPPAHPSFPSGHSFLGHFIALLLLEIPQLAGRYGVFSDHEGAPGAQISVSAEPTNPLCGKGPIRSPLLWLAQRVAKNRERLGVHYFSDSTGSRHLAAAVWRALLHEPHAGKRIECPTLRSVLRRAQAEWPELWS